MVKNRKNKYHWIPQFKLVVVPNFSLNWQFWFFGPDLPKSSISSLKKSEHHQFELVKVSGFGLNWWPFWILGPNLPKKDIYGGKWEVNITNEFSISAKFQLELTILFVTKLAQKGYFQSKMVVTYCIKLFRMGTNRHNNILMSLLPVAETIKKYSTLILFTNRLAI